MKCILACLLGTALTLSAQTNLESILSQSIQPAAWGAKPVLAEDKKVVISKTAELLEKHVTFRPDGTSSAFAQISSVRESVEWKNLRIHIITSIALTEADKLNGYEKRYLAGLKYDAYRRWDPKTKSWTKWQTTGHLHFPKGIYVEWKEGVATAKGNTYLPKFSPGPGPSIADKPQNLPKGIERK